MKLILLFLISFNFLFAQSGTESLKKIQNKFASISNFTANFVQFTFNEQGKSSAKLTGKIYYKRENKFVVELKNQTIISNGVLVWNYNHKQKQVIISNFIDEPTSFSLERYVFDYPSLCNVKLIKKDNNVEVIELIPRKDMLDIKDVKIWKNNEDMITKLEIKDVSDMYYSFQFDDIKINQDILESKFTFNPPKGIRIIDLR